jgi:Domain of Unknown Function with PDB structure (DUF3857)
MKKLIIALILITFLTPIYSQKDLPEFGKPDMKELLMKECEFEPGVSAMKILKYEHVDLLSANDWSVRTEKWERIKILSQAGYLFADIEIPFAKKNKIKKLAAYIYTLDESGKITTQEIESDDIFKKSDKKKKKGSLVFTFPGVKPGCVIEYKYTELEKEPYYSDTKFFQDVIPVQLCIYKLVHSEYIKANLTFIGGDENLESRIEEKTPVDYKNTQTITGTNIHSFRDEPLMSAVKDNLQYMTLRFEYRADWRDSLLKKYPEHNFMWDAVGSRLIYNPNFGEQIIKKVTGTESLIDSSKKIKDIAGKVELIYKRVRDRITWNNEFDVYAENIDRAWKTGIGSNAEINLLLLNLLRKAGVNSFPVLVRSREYGKPNLLLYTISQFNNVNVVVFNGENFYILDATKKHLSYNTPPFEVLNRNVLIIDADGAEWLTIVDDRPFLKQTISIKADVDSSGQIKGDAFVSFFDYIKDFKLTEKKEGEKIRAQEEKDFINSSPVDIKIDSLIEDASANELLPLNHRFTFTYNPESTDDFLFVDPFFLSPFRKNPFTDSIRRTDIDFGSNQYYTIYVHLTIPENYRIEGVPKNLVVISSDSTIIFKRQILQENNILVFKHSFEVKRAEFSKEEYLPLHDIFRKMYGAIKEQLILKKK